MKYVCLIYQGSSPLPHTPQWATVPADEQQAIYADYAALQGMPNVTPGLPFGLPEHARTVTVRNGETHTADGPFIDAAGAVGGYLLVEAEDLAEAVTVAAQIPAARLGGAVEVRPVETYW